MSVIREHKLGGTQPFIECEHMNYAMLVKFVPLLEALFPGDLPRKNHLLRTDKRWLTERNRMYCTQYVTGSRVIRQCKGEFGIVISIDSMNGIVWFDAVRYRVVGNEYKPIWNSVYQYNVACLASELELYVD
jgi:hypothetical protein